ncbi:MAG: MFS transporter [Candidatus Verstraetearchaeota archaeon]|nr:MFS transporter [Candidatus Verstraetearchaeota archaeon]
MNRSHLKVASILILASFIINLGFSSLSPIFPYLILAVKGVLKQLPELTGGMLQAHVGAVELGLLTAAFMVARAPTAGIIGFISDIFGKKRTIMIGMLLYTASSIGFLLSNQIPLFIVFRAVQGVASGMVWPVAEALLSDVSPRWSRGKLISIYSSSMMIAQVAGPSIGVAFYKLYVSIYGGGDVVTALKAPIILLTVFSAFSAITIIFLPKIEMNVGEVVGGSFRDLLKILRSLPERTARSFKVIYVNGLINGFAMGIIQTAAIVYMIERVAKDPIFIALFSSISSLAALPAALIAGYLSDRWARRKPFILIGYIFGRTAFFLIPLTTSYIPLLILGVMISLVFGFSSPIMRALQADLSPEGVRGSIFGLQQFFFNSGILLGALIGGYLTRICAVENIFIFGLTFTGYIIPFWTAGILGLLTATLFTLYVEEPSK